MHCSCSHVYEADVQSAVLLYGWSFQFYSKIHVKVSCYLTLPVGRDTLILSHYFALVELRLMFSLMDRVPDGITPMLHDLEAYIVSQGLADMIAAAETITTVSYLTSQTVPLPQ